MLEKRLNGNQLKLIAVITMLLDHTGYAMQRYIEEVMTMTSPGLQEAILVSNVLRTAGRISLPIFIFLLVEGFCHTSNQRRYLWRMGAFALLSEIPFDLMLTGEIWYPSYQNIFFTLFLALCMLMALQEIGHRFHDGVRLLLQMITILAVCGLAWVLKTDYDFFGIMLAALIYWFRGDRRIQCIAGFLLMINTVFAWYYGIGLLISFFLISLYNGERGRRRFGYAFYWFYPVHLLLIAGIYQMIR